MSNDDENPFEGLVFDDGEGEGSPRPADWAGDDWLDGARYFATGRSEEQSLESIRKWPKTVLAILRAAVERADALARETEGRPEQ